MEQARDLAKRAETIPDRILQNPLEAAQAIADLMYRYSELRVDMMKKEQIK